MNIENEFKTVQSRIQAEYDRLKELADAQVKEPMKLKKYTDPKKKQYRYSIYDNMWGTYDLSTEYYFWRNNDWSCNQKVTPEKLEQVLQKWDEAVEQWKVDNQDLYLLNQDAIAHNKLQYERVELIMKTLGVRTSFTKSYFKTSRSRKMTHETKAAQWPSEVRDALPMNCGWDAQLRKFDEKRERIKAFGEKWIKDNEERIRKEKIEQEAKEKEARKLKTLALLCAKYDLDIDSEVDDIRDTILGKDKYLHLAHYLLQNRNDWTGGFHYANTALSEFQIENKEDQDIHDCLEKVIEVNEEYPDGRVFRDCEYNYDVLFSMADENVMKDYNTIQEFVEEW